MIVNIDGTDYRVRWQHGSVENQHGSAPQTRCIITKGEKEQDVDFGVATVNYRDTFNKNVGRKISMERAVKNLPKRVRGMIWDAYGKMRNGNY